MKQVLTYIKYFAVICFLVAIIEGRTRIIGSIFFERYEDWHFFVSFPVMGFSLLLFVIISWAERSNPKEVIPGEPEA